MTNDPLRQALAGLADDVHDADLYGAAVRRSRRIAHQRAAAGTLSALTVLGLACGGLWHLHPPGRASEGGGVTAVAEPAREFPAPAPSLQPSPAATPRSAATTRGPAPRQPHPTRAGVASPSSRSLSDLPGQVFYAKAGASAVVRLAGDGDTRTVLTAAHSALGVSPDGRKIAYVADGVLLVAPTDGGAPERPYAGTVSARQTPAWSPDGRRLLIGADDDPAVLDVADGTLQTLPSTLAGSDFRWSGDGSKLVYATASCQLKVADADPSTTSAVTVPVLGDPDASDNPSGLGACRPVSVDATGRRVAVPLEPVDGDDGGDGSARVANAVVDTVTGGTDVLPVAGTVIGAVFDADGDLLVRTRDQGRSTLSLFSAGNTLLVQAHEPSRLAGLDLVAYTR